MYKMCCWGRRKIDDDERGVGVSSCFICLHTLGVRADYFTNWSIDVRGQDLNVLHFKFSTMSSLPKRLIIMS